MLYYAEDWLERNTGVIIRWASSHYLSSEGGINFRLRSEQSALDKFLIDLSSFYSTIATIDDVCRPLIVEGTDLGERQFWPSYELRAVIPAIPIRMFVTGRGHYARKRVPRSTRLTSVQMT